MLYFKQGVNDESEVSRAFQEFTFFLVSRHIGGPKVITHWASAELQSFAVSSENTDFSKKLFNMKIFSIKFMMWKGIFNFRVRWPLLEKMPVSPKFFLAHMYQLLPHPV